MSAEKNLKQRINEACRWLKKEFPDDPVCGIILGTGLGGIAEKMERAVEFSYGHIPHFPVSTAPSHAGKLVLGKLAGRTVAVLEGRFHVYEGYSMEAVTFPVRVLKALGAGHLILCSASGGLNPEYAKGDIVALEDHINFMGSSPLIGENDGSLGPRFPDLIEPYCKKMLELAAQAAAERNISLRRGVYIGVTGPNLETRAEYRMMRQWGADVVGMSTVPEAITAAHAGLKTLALSVVTDLCLPDRLNPLQIEEIIAVAGQASVKLDQIIEAVVAKL